MKRRVLFICTHNSARSQLAEGLLRHLGGERFEVFSAGTEATHVRPLAIQAMAEIGIDLRGQQSKTLERYLHQPFDEVITVCDTAAEACPVFPGAVHRRHWSFPDPSKATGSESEQLAIYRRVRNAIQERIEQELLAEAKSPVDHKHPVWGTGNSHYYDDGMQRGVPPGRFIVVAITCPPDRVLVVAISPATALESSIFGLDIEMREGDLGSLLLYVEADLASGESVLR